MSVASWKTEFYPIPAEEVAEKDAIAHSLQKWRGLTKENLQKHNIQQFGNEIRDNKENLIITDMSCALCHHYMDDDADPFSDYWCVKCPIYKLLGKSCDSGNENPYTNFTYHNDPKWMIETLEKALKNYETQNN